MGKAKIETAELKILGGITAFAIIYILFIAPVITTNKSFLSLNPIFQYLIFNFGFMLISIAVFGTIISMEVRKEFDWKGAILDGVATFFAFSFILDLWQPPFFLDIQGNQIISGDATAVNTSVDAMWAFIVNTVFPGFKMTMIPFLNISLLYLTIYIFVPILTAIIASLILSKGQFFKWFSFGGVGNAQK